MKKILLLLAVSLLILGCGQETSKPLETNNVTGALKVIEALTVNGAVLYKVTDKDNGAVIYIWHGYGGITVKEGRE